MDQWSWRESPTPYVWWDILRIYYIYIGKTTITPYISLSSQVVTLNFDFHIICSKRATITPTTSPTVHYPYSFLTSWLGFKSRCNRVRIISTSGDNICNSCAINTIFEVFMRLLKYSKSILPLKHEHKSFGNSIIRLECDVITQITMLLFQTLWFSNWEIFPSQYTYIILLVNLIGKRFCT